MIQNPYWDHTSFFDPLSVEVDQPHPLPDTIPFHPALTLLSNSSRE